MNDFVQKFLVWYWPQVFFFLTFTNQPKKKKHAYRLAEIPSNMILTRVRPSLFLPLITFSWGLVATLLSIVQNKEGLVGVRFVLGFVEWVEIFSSIYFLSKNLEKKNWCTTLKTQRSGFFPGVVS